MFSNDGDISKLPQLGDRHISLFVFIGGRWINVEALRAVDIRANVSEDSGPRLTICFNGLQRDFAGRQAERILNHLAKHGIIDRVCPELSASSDAFSLIYKAAGSEISARRWKGC